MIFQLILLYNFSPYSILIHLHSYINSYSLTISHLSGQTIFLQCRFLYIQMHTHFKTFQNSADTCLSHLNLVFASLPFTLYFTFHISKLHSHIHFRIHFPFKQSTRTIFVKPAIFPLSFTKTWF